MAPTNFADDDRCPRPGSQRSDVGYTLRTTIKIPVKHRLDLFEDSPNSHVWNPVKKLAHKNDKKLSTGRWSVPLKRIEQKESCPVAKKRSRLNSKQSSELSKSSDNDLESGYDSKDTELQVTMNKVTEINLTLEEDNSDALSVLIEEIIDKEEHGKEVSLESSTRESCSPDITELQNMTQKESKTCKTLVKNVDRSSSPVLNEESPKINSASLSDLSKEKEVKIKPKAQNACDDTEDVITLFSTNYSASDSEQISNKHVNQTKTESKFPTESDILQWLSKVQLPDENMKIKPDLSDKSSLESITYEDALKQLTQCLQKLREENLMLKGKLNESLIDKDLDAQKRVLDYTHQELLMLYRRVKEQLKHAGFMTEFEVLNDYLKTEWTLLQNLYPQANVQRWTDDYSDELLKSYHLLRREHSSLHYVLWKIGPTKAVKKKQQSEKKVRERFRGKLHSLLSRCIDSQQNALKALQSSYTLLRDLHLKTEYHRKVETELAIINTFKAMNLDKIENVPRTQIVKNLLSWSTDKKYDVFWTWLKGYSCDQPFSEKMELSEQIFGKIRESKAFIDLTGPSQGNYKLVNCSSRKGKSSGVFDTPATRLKYRHVKNKFRVQSSIDNDVLHVCDIPTKTNYENSASNLSVSYSKPHCSKDMSTFINKRSTSKEDLPESDVQTISERKKTDESPSKKVASSHQSREKSSLYFANSDDEVTCILKTSSSPSGSSSQETTPTIKTRSKARSGDSVSVQTPVKEKARCNTENTQIDEEDDDVIYIPSEESSEEETISRNTRSKVQIVDKSPIDSGEVSRGTNQANQSVTDPFPMSSRNSYTDQSDASSIESSSEECDPVTEMDRLPCAKLGIFQVVSHQHPLLVATDTGDITWVRKLMQDGISPNICTRDSVTPLHIAAVQGNNSIITLLLENNACPSPKSKYHDTPLHLAAENNNLESAIILIKAGATLDVNRANMTPVHVGVSRDNMYLIEKMMDLIKTNCIQELLLKCPLRRKKRSGRCGQRKRLSNKGRTLIISTLKRRLINCRKKKSPLADFRKNKGIYEVSFASPSTSNKGSSKKKTE